jgi:PAS domain S-box-containing protein
MNTVAEVLTGWKMDEASNKPIAEVFNIINETTREKVENPVDKVLQQGIICSLANHTILIRKDGTEISIDDSGAPIKDAKGITFGVVLVFRDITERRKAEIMLRQVEERNRLLADILEHASQPFGIGLPDGSLGIVNKAFCELTGYTAEELKTLDWAKVLTPPEYLSMEAEKLAELVKTGQPVRYQKEYIRKDGSRVPIELLVNLARSSNGQVEYYYSFLIDITERKKAEHENKRLIESERKRSEELQLATENLTTSNKALLQANAQAERNYAEIEAMIQAIPDAVYFGNENGITRCNARALEMLGASSLRDLQTRIGELGAKFRVRYQKDRNSPLVEPENLPFTRGLKGEVAMLDTWATQGSTGEDVYIRGNAAPVIVDGKVIGAVAVNIDITERKQNEEEVHRLNRELKAINECDQVIVHTIDEQALLDKVCSILHLTAGYHMAWIGAVEHDQNRSIKPIAWSGSGDYLLEAKITWADTERGRGPTGLAARTGKTHFFQDFAKESAAAPWRQSALAHGYRSSIAIPLFDRSGAVFAVFTLYSTEPGYFDGAEIRLLEALAGDIAFGISALRDRVQRQQAEEEARRRTVELETVMNLVPVAIWVAHDPQCNNITGNRTANEFYDAEEGENVSAGPAPGEPIPSRRFFRNGKELTPEELPMQEAAARNMDIKGSEFNVILPNGKSRTLWGSASPLRDADGQVRGVVAAFLDITAREKAEEEIRRRTAELEAANKELEAFSYSVSHDLRAPLRSITGFSNVLLEDYSDELDGEGKSYLKKISDSGELMGQLMDDLLKLSRVARIDLTKEKLDLSEMARKIVGDLATVEPQQKVKVNIAPNMTANGDKNLLGLVLQNLLGNAWKYSSKNSKPIIEMGTVEHNGKPAYFVRDNGVGFEMTYANKLFKPFQRLHKASEFEGTGIGLATVQRIIRRHGGEVWAEAKIGEGATFYFTLN